MYESVSFTGNKVVIKEGREVNHNYISDEIDSFSSLKVKDGCKLKLCFTSDRTEKCEHYTKNFDFTKSKKIPFSASCTCEKISDDVHKYSKRVVSNSTKIFFKRAGKGTIRFLIKPLNGRKPFFGVQIGNGRNRIHLTFKDKDVSIADSSNPYKFNKTLVRKPKINLCNFNSTDSYIWISIEGHMEDEKFNMSYFIKVGYGYVMQNNLLFSFVPSNPEAKKFVKEIEFIDIDRDVLISDYVSFICFTSFFRDRNPALVVRANLHDLNRGFIVPANLPNEGQALYNTIKDVNIEPEVIDAINYSLDNEGCELYNKLNSKSTFSKKNTKSSYIRVSLNSKLFSSPGLPFVLEIWPKGHSSPIHNHGDSVAVIKVLKGSLLSKFYNPLPNMSYYEPELIREDYLHETNFTWMTPDFYQTHLLLNYRDDSATITFQSYSHLEDSDDSDEKFNYIVPESPELKYFYPKSDYLYDENFENIILNEYRTKSCKKKTATKPKECQFKTQLCGRTIKSLEEYKNDQLKENGIYECDKLKKTPKLVKLCPIDHRCEPLTAKCEKIQQKTAYAKIKGCNRQLGTKIQGDLKLEQLNLYDIRVSGEITGLNKKSMHGFHIHEGDDCENPGPHFNPYMIDKHGNLIDDIFNKHLGDLGNLETDSQGRAKVDIQISQMTIDLASEFNILKRLLVISQDADDLGRTNKETSLVDGNSGPNIACGVIEDSEPLDNYSSDETNEGISYISYIVLKKKTIFAFFATLIEVYLNKINIFWKKYIESIDF